MSEAVRQEVHDGVLVLVIDNPPVNASSGAVRAGLAAGLQRLASDADLVAGVLIGDRDTFVAGSDIREFEGVVPEPLLPTVIAAIEACPRPVVAAIDGVALGGGLELALGCDARLATPQARLGLPEVSLGMVPGAGGTQRLPRLVGRTAALDLILTGRRVSGAEAVELGLVDALSAGDLRQDAVAMARRTSKRPLGPVPVPEEDPAALQRTLDSLLRGGRDRPHAREAVELVRAAGVLPMADALADERARFDRLRVGPEAAALRHAFFAERTAPRRRGVRPASVPVTRVGVVGAGAMGVGIAVSLASHGICVQLVDADADRAREGLEQARRLIGGAARRGRLDPAEAVAAEHALAASSRIADLAGCEVVVEAVFEDLDVKATVLRSAAQAAPAAVLATNTSYLGVDRLAGLLDAPRQLVGLHFFNPANVMRLVEVVPGPRTDPDAVAVALRLVRQIDKQAVVAGDGEGFIGNRLYAVYRRHAEYLLEDGALPAEVDAALEDFGFAMGPFAVADLSGLQIAQAMRDRRRAEGRLPARYVDIPDLLCERGRLGRRTSAGYYRYGPDGGREADEEVTELVRAESARKGIARRALDAGTIVRRTMAAMVVEGCRAVADGTAAHADDIDVVLLNGFGFPRHRGGPMWWASQQAPDALARAVAEVAEVAREEESSALVREVLARD